MTNHGAKGGDWFGTANFGENYGWKILGWGGTNYSGSKIGPKWKPGFTKAIKYWVPSIAVSAMTIYKGETFNEWNGDALITSLKDQSLRRIKFKDNEFISEEIIFKDKIGRIRDIKSTKKQVSFICCRTKENFGECISEKIFILTGEPSGDKLASKVISQLKNSKPDIEYLSVGGENLKSLGIKSLYDLKEVTYLGFTKGFTKYLSNQSKINQTVKEILKFKPDILFSVDSPDFTLRVAKEVKKRPKY